MYEVPRIHDLFTLGERIGRGAWGDVLRARDLATGEVVAVKRMHSRIDESAPPRRGRLHGARAGARAHRGGAFSGSVRARRGAVRAHRWRAAVHGRRHVRGAGQDRPAGAPRLSEVKHGVSAELDALLALARSPEQRFPSARAFAHALGPEGPPDAARRARVNRLAGEDVVAVADLEEVVGHGPVAPRTGDPVALHHLRGRFRAAQDAA
jgi:hypothetical protein